jgi:glycosyltransferase involved in cell wall biosynthesis
VNGARRVVYLSPTAQLGGAEQSLLDLAAALDRGRYLPGLVCLDEGPLLASAARRGITVERVAMPHSFARTSLRGRRSSGIELGLAALRALPTATALGRVVRRGGAALVHSNGNKTHALSLRLALSPVPIVWHVRDFLPSRAPERMLLRMGAAVGVTLIANSAAVASHLHNLGVAREGVHTIVNGIDIVRFHPEGPRVDLRAELGWPASTRVVGMVGVLARWKGQEVFLRAVRQIADRALDVRFAVVGGELYRTRGHGGFEAGLRALTHELGLNGVVGFTGHRDDVPGVLRGLDVVVHASIEPEPFGRVIAEAMACACPVVWARGGGADEIVGDGGLTALGVAPGDEQALACAIMRALDEPEAARRWAREGRQRIASGFDLARHLQRVQDIYDRLTAGRA